MFLDSHCHLNYLPDPRAAIERARLAGVAEMLCIGVNRDGIDEVLHLAETEEGVWATVGEHPDGASGDPSWIPAYLTHARVVAVGETGLDYFHTDDAQARANQRASFRQQMQMALDADLPVVIHTRDAAQDTLDVLAAFPGVRGVLHCFTESWSMAQSAMDLGYYISISGIVTFNNAANVRDVAGRVPAERLLIETDAPWLSPVPHRGKSNEPARVGDTARFLAELRGEALDDLARTTRSNFFDLFNRATLAA